MTLFFLNLAGAVALLLWAVRLIRSGVERAFLAPLRSGLRRASRGPLTALAGGTAAALMLQSSTAVALLVAAFAASGTVTAPAGLAIVLGADLGSALVARVLVAPIAAAVPVLLVPGVAFYLRARNRRLRETGRILIGLALALLALELIRDATAPLADSRLVALIVGYLAGDLLGAFLIGAVLAWALHSSVAAVLTFVTFAATGLLPALPAAALVLGANLGGALIAVVLTLSAARVARQITLGNAVLRGGAAALALLALARWPGALDLLGAAAAAQVIALHVAFNVALAVLALPLRGPVLTGLDRLLPDGATRVPDRLSALDQRALDRPDRALASASRELLRMAERLHGMLTQVMTLYDDCSPGIAAAILDGEAEIDRMHFEIKLYVAQLQERRLSAAQSRRAMDVAWIANNLEDAGDQLSSILAPMARRMADRGLAFSTEGRGDLFAFHARVVDNARLALDVLMTGDPEAARQLVEEKDRLRDAEQRLQERHLERLRGRNPGTLETSNLHQETLRALKQINTAFTTAAYPIAEESGDLLNSRLALSSTRDV